MKASPCRIGVYAMSRSGHNSIMAWMRANLLDSETTVFNIEEADITQGVHGHATTHVIVLRDPYNWFASWLTAGRKWKDQARIESESERFIDLWKALAHEIRGETNYLQKPCIPILYNKWVTHSQYRAKLAYRLDMSHDDKDLLRVDPAGGGSTWDGNSFDGRANEMDVFNRWRHLEKDDWYRKHMLDPELDALSVQLFELPCPLKD